MLRISKLTDYALVILTEMQESQLHSASSLSQLTHIPLATTNKILKLLLIGKICSSKSGKMGGFLLVQPKHKISLLAVIQTIDGCNMRLTQCHNNNSSCQLIKCCKITDKMNLIDKEINNILSNKFISDLC
jgi:Rrf2 family protein